LRRRPGLWLGVIVCGVLTIAIVAPLAHSGTLLLLDYGTFPAGQHPQLDSSIWGFPPGLVTRAPVDIVLFALFHVINWGWLRLLPFVLLAPLAWIGFRRLLGVRYLAVAAATTLYVVNPWSDDRMSAGQVYLVVGYALLPLLASMLLARATRPLRHAIATGLLIALLVALAPHFIFIAGLLMVIALAVCSSARDWERVKTIGGSLLAVGAVGVYWIVPALIYHPEALPVTNADLTAFQTSADTHLGLGVNVLGLYGFWRPGAPLPKDFMTGWPFILLAILIVAGIGGWFAWRHLHNRTLVLTLGVTALMAFFLAMGDQGPTGAVFGQLYEHVPGFAIMREPEKFSALLALAYATFFGLGISCAYTIARRRAQRMLVVGLALAVPCAYGFTTFWGFAGYASPSNYPASWAPADSLMGSGDQAVLALPWHLYLDFPWTQGRTVVNPMASYFQRPVISGDNIEAGDIETESSDPRSSYLEYLFSVGSETTHLGRLLAPLGIRYILLAKTDDWKDYGFMDTQTDIRVVRSWGDLTLFENTEPAPLATAPPSTVTVDTWGDVIGLAQEASLTDYYVVVRNPGPGPIREPDLDTLTPPSSSVSVSSGSPVQVTLHTTSGAARVVLAEPYDSSWSMNGERATEELGALTGFTNVPTGGVSIDYGRWPVVRGAYIASGVVTLVLIGFAALPLRRRRRRVSVAAEITGCSLAELPAPEPALPQAGR
jgi:hypothetical protein